MHRLLLLIVFAFACVTAVRPATAPAPAPPAAPNAMVERDGALYAVVELVDWCGEASNLGGSHWSFRVVGEHHLLHGGGHGVFARDDLPTWDGQTVATMPADRRYFVAKIDLGSARDRHGLGVWCPEQPAYTGDVIELGRAKGLDDARARLATVARTGALADVIEMQGAGGPGMK